MVDGCGGCCCWWRYFAKVFFILGYIAVYKQELQLQHPKLTPLLPGDFCFTDTFLLRLA